MLDWSVVSAAARADASEETAVARVAASSSMLDWSVVSAAMRADGAIQKLVDERYASWSGPLGKRIEAGTESFQTLETEMLAKGEAEACKSGRQELFENVINTYL